MFLSCTLSGTGFSNHWLQRNGSVSVSVHVSLACYFFSLFLIFSVMEPCFFISSWHSTATVFPPTHPTHRNSYSFCSVVWTLACLIPWHYTESKWLCDARLMKNPVPAGKRHSLCDKKYSTLDMPKRPMAMKGKCAYTSAHSQRCFVTHHVSWGQTRNKIGRASCRERV